MEEQILTESTSRFTVFPIEHDDLWDMYMKAQNSFWVFNEIDYAADLEDWAKLSDGEKHFIKMILAFFAGADGIVLENILTNFGSEVKISEARLFYAFQGMIENTHGIVYSLLIDTFVEENEKMHLFHAIDNIPAIAEKANWALKWFDSSIPFAQRLIAFAVVEGVFFSGSFCAIFWLKSRGIMTKALGTSNELIARDEGMHTDFAIMLYKKLENSAVEKDLVYDIFKEAVEIERGFICESLPCSLIGMNSDLMNQYIRFVADRLIQQLGYPKLFGDTNPFSFMEWTGLDGKTNFFEKRVTEYTLSSAHDDKFETTDDF